MYAIVQYTDFIPTIDGFPTTQVEGVCPDPPRNDEAFRITNPDDLIFYPSDIARSPFDMAFPPAYMCYIVTARIGVNNTADILKYVDEDGIFNVSLRITAASITLDPSFGEPVTFNTAGIIDLADGMFKYIQLCTQGNGQVTLYVDCIERGREQGVFPQDNVTSVNDGFLLLGEGMFEVSCPTSCCLYCTVDSAYGV